MCCSSQSRCAERPARGVGCRCRLPGNRGPSPAAHRLLGSSRWAGRRSRSAGGPRERPGSEGGQRARGAVTHRPRRLRHPLLLDWTLSRLAFCPCPIRCYSAFVPGTAVRRGPDAVAVVRAVGTVGEAKTHRCAEGARCCERGDVSRRPSPAARGRTARRRQAEAEEARRERDEALTAQRAAETARAAADDARGRAEADAEQARRHEAEAVTAREQAERDRDSARAEAARVGESLQQAQTAAADQLETLQREHARALDEQRQHADRTSVELTGERDRLSPSCRTSAPCWRANAPTPGPNGTGRMPGLPSLTDSMIKPARAGRGRAEAGSHAGPAACRATGGSIGPAEAAPQPPALARVRGGVGSRPGQMFARARRSGDRDK